MLDPIYFYNLPIRHLRTKFGNLLISNCRLTLAASCTFHLRKLVHSLLSSFSCTLTRTSQLLSTANHYLPDQALLAMSGKCYWIQFGMRAPSQTYISAIHGTLHHSSA